MKYVTKLKQIRKIIGPLVQLLENYIYNQFIYNHHAVQLVLKNFHVLFLGF